MTDRPALPARPAAPPTEARPDTQPLVSVVTPSYNQARWLEDNLLSVKNQTWRPIEHLVVDGGSKDGTLDVLRRHEGVYDLTWISEPDKGQSDAINKGFRMARGDIVGWINSDDAYYHVRAVEEAVRAFQRHPDVDVVYGNAVRIDHESAVRNVIQLRPWSYDYLEQTCFLVQPSVFFRRSVVEEFQLDVSLQVAMDYDFWLRVGKTRKFLYVDRVFGVDRQQPDRKVLTRKPAMARESRQVSPRYGSLYEGRLRKMRSVAVNEWRILLGLREVLRLRSAYEPAFPVKLPKLGRALLQQVHPATYR